MRPIPGMKILHRTIFHLQIFPQVKTNFRSLVLASTKLRGSRSSAISNNLRRKSLKMRKVIPIFSTSGKIKFRNSDVIQPVDGETALSMKSIARRGN